MAVSHLRCIDTDLPWVQDFVADLKRRPVAEQTEAANEQHYEVPTEFYLLCLGKHLKYR